MISQFSREGEKFLRKKGSHDNLQLSILTPPQHIHRIMTKEIFFMAIKEREEN